MPIPKSSVSGREILAMQFTSNGSRSSDDDVQSCKSSSSFASSTSSRKSRKTLKFEAFMSQLSNDEHEFKDNQEFPTPRSITSVASKIKPSDSTSQRFNKLGRVLPCVGLPEGFDRQSMLALSQKIWKRVWAWVWALRRLRVIWWSRLVFVLAFLMINSLRAVHL